MDFSSSCYVTGNDIEDNSSSSVDELNRRFRLSSISHVADRASGSASASGFCSDRCFTNCTPLAAAKLKTAATATSTTNTKAAADLSHLLYTAYRTIYDPYFDESTPESSGVIFEMAYKNLGLLQQQCAIDQEKYVAEEEEGHEQQRQVLTSI